MRKDINTNFVLKTDFENMKKRIDDSLEHIKDLDKKHNNNDININQCRDITD